MGAAVNGSPMLHADPEVDAVRRRALSKVAWRFLPVLTIAYVLNYLDRTSVGIAALTMNRDLGLTAYQFGWGAGLLFASYSLCEIPSNLILYRFGARRWIARIMITWGLIAAANALVVGPTSFYLVRLLLGAAEAGFFPGITFFLAAWFPAHYRARVLAWFLVAIPVSSVLGGPISGLLLELDGLAGLAGWQWMFVVEGIPACIVGFFILKLLSDRPEQANWLSPDEREAMAAMLNEEQRDRARHSLWSALSDVRVLILTGIQFGYTLGSYGIGIWLPQILKTHGLSNLTVSFVSAIPYVFASVAMLVWAAYVDRAGRKILNLTLGFLLATIGFVVSVGWTDLAPALIGLTIALVGVTSARAIFWTVPTSFLTGRGAAGGLAFITTIGSLGGFFGPFLIGWIKDTTGSFILGLLAMAAILAITTALSATLRLFVRQD
ncbi:MAG: transporter, family, tartrate transporter [Acetobacteraceae bacterium]|nr:transporter, family, tartrate transporter [Acetobacteraceae bacterium]